MIKRKFKYFFKENWFILVFLLVCIFGIFCNIKAASEVASEAKRCGLLGMSYTEYEETHNFTDYETFNFYKHIAEERKAKCEYTEPIFTEAKPFWWEE